MLDLTALHESLAGVVLGDRGIAEVLTEITGIVRRAIPGSEASSITLIRGETAFTAAFDGQMALVADELQYQRGYGPCVDAGRAAQALLRAMSRGYRGSMASFHADSAKETFESMATLLIDHAPSLTHEAAMRQIATALDFIVFIDREHVTDRVTGEPTEIRYVSEIVQVGNMTSDSPVPMTAEVFGPHTDPEARLLDPRGYPRGPLPVDENLWARRAGLDMAWLTDEHGAWDSAFPIRGLS